MSLEIYLAFKYNKLLFETLAVETQEVVFLEMLLQRVVVLEVMWLPGIASVTDEAPLVLIPAMFVKLIAIIETFAAETTERVSLKTCLVDGSGLVVTFSHMFLQLLVCKQLMLVCKDLLVTSAEITHLLVVNRPHMAVEVWPAQSGEVAGVVRAVVPEKEDSIADDVFIGVPDTDVFVCTGDVVRSVILESFRIVIREDHERRGSLALSVSRCTRAEETNETTTYPTMWTVFILIERP